MYLWFLAVIAVALWIGALAFSRSSSMPPDKKAKLAVLVALSMVCILVAEGRGIGRDPQGWMHSQSDVTALVVQLSSLLGVLYTCIATAIRSWRQGQS